MSQQRIKKRKKPDRRGTVSDWLRGQMVLAAQATVDEMLVALHTPKEAAAIMPQQKLLLEKINSAVAGYRDFSAEQLLTIQPADDCHTFPHSNIDLATVSNALQRPEAAAFFAPLFAGEAFLQHVTRCQFCLLQLAIWNKPLDPVTTIGVAVGMAELDQVMAQQGLVVANPRAGTIYQAVKGPKPQ